jgi:cyanophycinase
MRKIYWPFLFIAILIFSCQNKEDAREQSDENQPKGKLFIIGGGKKPQEMLKNLATISGIDSSGYVVVLPMSSSVPDTSGYWITYDFNQVGVENVHVFNMQSEKEMTESKLDSVRNARLIYMTGGNQNTFMEIAGDTPLIPAIREAYKKGATVAGTSAGAALMSAEMITGDEFKHPEYTGYFRTIEARNIELKPGVGLIQEAIIDQHFIQRMRMNRLISAILENPDKVGIGIDESTAILVDGNNAEVYGIGQVMVFRNTKKETRIQEGLLGVRDMNLSIYLPGETFQIKEN